MESGYWASAVFDRHQAVLFAPRLDDMLPEDHPARLYDELLRELDWTDWELRYPRKEGRPPIHPRIMATFILYGLNLKIQSSRLLEDACRHRIDLMWLGEGRVPDHSTICDFKKEFKGPLKGLFRQIGRVAMKAGLIRLVEIAVDGTKVRANSSRHGSATAATLEKELAELEAQIEQGLAEMEEADREEGLLGDEHSTHQLPKELATQEKRRVRIGQALEAAKALDESRRQKRGSAKAKPAKVPRTDPDSRVTPNKEGGFAPNYTPLAAVDGHLGMIIDADVINDSAEAAEALPAMDRIKESLGTYPCQVAADGAYGTGPNLEGLESRQIDVLTPVKRASTNPAQREDPSQPVPEAQWPELPRNGRGQLDRVCFVYIESKDVYYCPTGQVLEYEETKRAEREGGTANCRVYRSRSCEGCPLAKQCLASEARARTVRRDQYEEHRERLRDRMSTEEAKHRYRSRMPIAETPFGHIKQAMGLRQFLLRGLTDVKTEWFWVCTAFNTAKLIRHMAELRAHLAKMTAG